MQSQDESVLHLIKAALVGSIIYCKRLNCGAIIALEILTRAKQFQTLLPFPILIIALCRRAKFPRNEKSYVEVTLSASMHIRRIEANYLRDEEARDGQPHSLGPLFL